MDKIRRLDRVVAMTRILTARPGHLFALADFCEQFGAAKSSVSEDLLAIKQILQHFDLGHLETVAGAAGGVRFYPVLQGDKANQILVNLAERLSSPDRILPGGFLYISDIFFDTALMEPVGEIFMSRFAHTQPDHIMTVETKGIPLGMMVSRAFNKPLVIVRRNHKVTEGPTISINYVSGSSRRIQSMSVSTRAMSRGSRVLLIDDFMKAGGTAKGMADLVNEMGGEVVGTGVLVATAQPQPKLIQDYLPLLILEEVEEATRCIQIHPSLQF